MAPHAVNTHQGRAPAGMDGTTRRNVNGDLDGNLARLREARTAQTVAPRPVSRVSRPQAQGHKSPGGLPPLEERRGPEALRRLLEPRGDTALSTPAAGVRPNRSTSAASASLGNRCARSGAEADPWGIEGDRASAVDPRPPRRWRHAVQPHGADRALRDRLWTVRRAGGMADGPPKDTLTGPPQGGSGRSLAATLSRPALETSRASTSLPRTPSQRSKRSTQGHGTVLDVRDAAAVVGLCHGTKAEAHASTEARKACLRPLGLTLAEAKTHVTPSPAGCPCLGDTILKNVGERGTRGPKGVRPDSASAPCRSPRRGMLAPSTPSASRQAKSAALTSVTRGGCPYDRATRHPVTTCSTLELFPNKE